MVATAKEKKVKTLDIREAIKDPVKFPWKVSSGSIDEITCVGVFEFVPGKLRGQFMDEVFRVLAPSGKATFAVAYWNTAKGFQDYRYEWPPLCEQSFLFFNKAWREANTTARLVCDFDFTYGYTPDAETGARSEESRAFYIKRYTNCVEALHLLLTKR